MYISVDDLRRTSCPEDPMGRAKCPCIPIIAISLPWLHPEHPDPLGDNLKLIGEVLAFFVERAASAAAAVVGEGRTQRWGVLWDFASLFQHLPSERRRDAREERLFQEGLQSLADFYSHPYTRVFRLTRFPEGYPASYEQRGYGLPTRANASEYMERGWCFTETCWASMIKPSWLCLDLGQYSSSKQYDDWFELTQDCVRDGARIAPKTPAQFEEELCSKTFTNGKEDQPRVSQLYLTSFVDLLGNEIELIFEGLNWGDSQAEQVAAVIKTGCLRSLETLTLKDNDIGDRGMRTLASAIREAALPMLREVVVAGNPRASDAALEEVNRSLDQHVDA
jgi:hypothetical protein